MDSICNQSPVGMEVAARGGGEEEALWRQPSPPMGRLSGRIYIRLKPGPGNLPPKKTRRSQDPIGPAHRQKVGQGSKN